MMRSVFGFVYSFLMVLLFHSSFAAASSLVFENEESWKKSSEWEDIYELIDEQKYQKALTLTEKNLKEFIEDKDEKNWALALIIKHKLLNSLQQLETSVEQFKSFKWPQDIHARILLQLYYAQTLSDYYHQYSWEINKRERIVSSKKKPLKKWVKAEIFQEIEQSFFAAWRLRNKIQQTKAKVMAAFLAGGNYPEGVRDTLRDKIIYFYVQFLADTNFWSSAEENSVELLPLDQLLATGADVAQEQYLRNSKNHPLQKMVALLAEHEKWHWNHDRLAALMEARYELIRKLLVHFHRDEHLKKYNQQLKNFLRDKPDMWWAEGMYLRAKIVSQMSHDTSKIEARAIALKGKEAYPEAKPGQRCAHIVSQIESPYLRMKNMKRDSAQKRSIEIEHANIEKLYFRAYQFDLLSFILKQKKRRNYLRMKDISKLTAEKEASYTWMEEVHDKGDFRHHKSFIIPKIDKKDFYIIVASADKEFKTSKNKLMFVFYQQTDLFLIREQKKDGYWFSVLDARTGAPLNKATIDIYKLDWRKKEGSKLYKTLQTNEKGEVLWKQKTSSSQSFLAVLKNKKDWTIAGDAFYVARTVKESQKLKKLALIASDRSIFRPGQKINFKVISYKKNMAKYGLPSAAPGQSLEVQLLDSNYKVVETKKMKTNSYATAAGSFTIPTGRALGRWSLRTVGYSASYQFNVEEYKRPTFYVSLDEAKEQVRLNTLAKFKGQAKYYFGMAVANAQVKYTVKRQVFYPYWYRWWYTDFGNQNQIIKTGQTKTNNNGEYEVEFFPHGPIGKKAKGIEYQYLVEVEVLNEGGETSIASKSFRVGAASIKLVLGPKTNFNTKGVEFELKREDLNGKPTAGEVIYTLYSLRQPLVTLAPAEQELYYGEMKPLGGKFSTDGDFKRSRWQGKYDSEFILKTWKIAKVIDTATINIGKQGSIQKKFVNLATGAYRLVVKTKDKFETNVENEHNFLIVGNKAKLNLPFVFRASKTSGHVGEQLQFYAHSGYPGQQMVFQLYQGNKLLDQQLLMANKSNSFIKYRIKKEHLGGLSARLYTVHDHTFMQKSLHIDVPFIKQELDIDLARIRKKLFSGSKVQWDLKIKGHNRKGKRVKLKERAEVLVYMYDKSLDVFTSHHMGKINWPHHKLHSRLRMDNIVDHAQTVLDDWYSLLPFPTFKTDHLKTLASSFLGGMESSPIPVLKRSKSFSLPKSGGKIKEVSAEASVSSDLITESEQSERSKLIPSVPSSQTTISSNKIRSNFAETGLWMPQLKTAKNGDLKLSFTVPDTLTSWKVWAQAITKSFKFAISSAEVESIKDLMVRTYFPRFLRQGDNIQLKVVINNGGNKKQTGKMIFSILDSTDKSAAALFKLNKKFTKGLKFNLKPGASVNFTIPIQVPSNKIGEYKFKAIAKTKGFSDGELKSLNILPSRIYLAESKFISLTDKEQREFKFENMLTEDKTRISGDLNIKLDTQLFYSVLSALPYLYSYPYECVTSFLYAFTSTSILSSSYNKFPYIKQMASKLGDRKTRLEKWNLADPNRKMQMVETPWMYESEGGETEKLLNLLKPANVQTLRNKYLAKIIETQTHDGGFPWFKGGRPSLFMTIQFLKSMARAQEFGAETPTDAIRNAWRFVGGETKQMIDRCIKKKTCYASLTSINFILSSYKDKSVFQEYISQKLRKRMLNFSFEHWKKHPPYLKAMLALTLKRMNREDDAKLVFASIMDSSKEEKDLGVYWAPEDRSWLWYNDNIESHAFTLRTMMELTPKDKKRHGLVKWLFLNKKLNQWKSTRATAEVIYSLLHYLKDEDLLNNEQKISLSVGNIQKNYVFKPDAYTGKDNFLTVKANKLDLKTMNTVKAKQSSKGMSFVSATWHYSTEKLPEKAKGDLFNVRRSFFKRVKKNDEVQLLPLEEGTMISVGDEVEIHLSITAKHASEYVHLRDPRPSGFEPLESSSGYQYDLGLVRYQEVRDSGMNFFLEQLPTGEYTLKHRIRANMAGEFRTHPAVLQSFYAPEFNAFSRGKRMTVEQAN